MSLHNDKVVFVRMSNKLHQAIKDLAKHEEQTVTSLMRRAIMRYLVESGFWKDKKNQENKE